MPATPRSFRQRRRNWAAEYLSLDLAVAVVASLDEAVRHIRRWGSGYTEAILTRSQHSARRFAATVDAAAVMVNCSTRFTDGYIVTGDSQVRY